MICYYKLSDNFVVYQSATDMATPVIMPRQGQSVETCLITRWFKAVGDAVNEGDLLFSYETDKAAFDEESKVSGEMLAVFFEEGEEVPVFENVCVIGRKGEAVDALKPSKDAIREEDHTSGTPVVEASRIHGNETTAMSESRPGHSLRISPRARRKAAELGLSLDGIRGTGPKQRIIERDVLAQSANHPKITPLARQMIEKDRMTYDAGRFGRGSRVTSKDLMAPGSDAGYRKIPHSRVRQIIAENMQRSLQSAAQLTHHLGADARNMLSLRQRIKEAPGTYQDITLNDMVCYAVVQSLLAFPEMNAQWHTDATWQFHSVHLGMAVQTDRGLMVPVLQNAETYTLRTMSVKLKELARACQEGQVDPDLLNPQAGTFTVSNLGAYGIEMFTPVLNLPQIGLLGVNTIQPRPTDLGDGVFGFVPHIGLSLTYDHRAIDGAPASAFLKSIKEQIESFHYSID